MVRILLTGLSGAGKSTLLNELVRRGHDGVDTDYGGWMPLGAIWDESRMDALLADPGYQDGAGHLLVVGTAENQGRFYDRFDTVVLLSAPLAVLLDRVSGRSNNPYGRSASDRAEIVRYFHEVQPLLRAGADVELDGTHSVGDLADTIESLFGNAG
ncbi:AAA family ATPase [Glutamicibacter sp. MNS18]|uniref:AAA family ATPase n=1 Tax=Glutamicibacter sp. MNS18 TaxID=2989817 RepID=UPI00223576F2|nr:AAA family ATPase [Glutamicibacter sp. MNS18]MCW4464946.1 AAA family ATPase [Glutamicibacter sp. MNS18]